MKIVWRWLQGFIIATLLTWGLGAVCVTEINNCQWNETVGAYLQRDTRSIYAEGSGTVYFDNLGILGASAPIRPADQHVLFWGNSFVEGLQVGDENAIYTQFTSLAKKDNSSRGLAIALSGRGFSDYLYLLPFYAKHIPNIQAHIIVFTMPDVSPNGNTLLIDGSEVWTHIPQPQKLLGVRPFIVKYRLHAFWDIFSRATKAAGELRIAVGPVHTDNQLSDANEPITSNWKSIPSEKMQKFWERLLHEVARRQEECGRIVLVCHPASPMLENGKCVLVDEYSDATKIFMDLAKAQGLEIIDLGPVFAQYVRETNQFPRGFSNTFPGKGHWNVAGHALVAETVYHYLKTHPTPEQGTK